MTTRYHLHVVLPHRQTARSKPTRTYVQYFQFPYRTYSARLEAKYISCCEQIFRRTADDVSSTTRATMEWKSLAIYWLYSMTMAFQKGVSWSSSTQSTCRILFRVSTRIIATVEELRKQIMIDVCPTNNESFNLVHTRYRHTTVESCRHHHDATKTN